MALDAALAAQVRDWIAADPDPRTRDELDDLLDRAEAGDADAADDLADRFAADLDFGTAGLRGALGGGPNRMNLAVVTRAANGIVSWLRAEGAADAAVPRSPGNPRPAGCGASAFARAGGGADHSTAPPSRPAHSPRRAWSVRSTCSGVMETRPLATAWKSVPSPASRASPAGPIQ